MVDLSKVKERLSTIQNTSSKNSSLWKPSPGSQIVRFIPYKFNMEFPFMELYFHYGIQGKSILSLKSFNESDPISEFAEKLKLSGNRDDYRLGKRFEPKMRIYAPMIVRGEESNGVKFWGFGKMVYQELLSIMNDEDYGDITNPSSGRDVVVDYKSAEEVGRSFPETKVRVKPNQTILFENEETSKKLIENQQDIFSIFKKQDYNTLQQLLSDYLKGSDDDEPSPSKVVEEPKELSSEEHQKDVSTAFDELFDN